MHISQEKIQRIKKDKTIALFANNKPISVTKLIGKHIAILGMTGSGKTVTGARLAEGLIKTGALLAICDTEGDYTGLASWSDSISIYGRKQTPESKGISDQGINRAVNRLIDDHKNIILLLDQYKKDDRLERIRKFVNALWDRVRLEKPKLAIFLYIDEAHEKAPQNRPADKELKVLLEDVAKMGRKRGLSLVVLSQRPAEIDKNILTQCAIRIMHRVTYPNDIGTYSLLLTLSDDLHGNYKAVRQSVTRFQRGQAWFCYPSFTPNDEGQRRVQVLMRESQHTSNTPGAEVLL